MMKILRMILVAASMLWTSSCNDVPPQLAEGLRSVRPPRGSTISYAYLPAGTTLLPSNINHTPAYHATNACYAVFIDEQPEYDYAHGLHLFLAANNGAITTLFHGDGFPDFHFQREDGSLIGGTEWKRY